MKRRSFLGFLAGLVATPAAAKAGASFFKDSPGANDPGFGMVIPDCGDRGFFRVSQVSGQCRIVVDEEACVTRYEFGPDAITRSSITAAPLRVDRLGAISANFGSVTPGVLRA